MYTNIWFVYQNPFPQQTESFPPQQASSAPPSPTATNFNPNTARGSTKPTVVSDHSVPGVQSSNNNIKTTPRKRSRSLPQPNRQFNNPPVQEITVISYSSVYFRKKFWMSYFSSYFSEWIRINLSCCKYEIIWLNKSANCLKWCFFSQNGQRVSSLQNLAF